MVPTEELKWKESGRALTRNFTGSWKSWKKNT